jgi:L-lactate dehydrogenase complex protein LldE
MSNPKPRVGLFVTCLVDLMRPAVGFAAIKLLQDQGCAVEVPEAQTCCGQPAFNSGDRQDAASIAKATIEAFAPYDYVVAPSGSCAAMIAKHYPELFTENTPEREAADSLASRTYELTDFLTRILKVETLSAQHYAKITYHDSCSGLRELGVKQAPRQLLSKVKGAELHEMENAEICCGFGGTFCVKYPDISSEMAARKTEAIAQTKAELLLAGDLGCLMNLAGKLAREGSPIDVRHVAEVLAGEFTSPPIGKPE